MLSASASSASSKQAGGARTVPAPIWPIPASFMGNTSINQRRNPCFRPRDGYQSPRQVPRKSQPGICSCILRSQIDFRHLFGDSFAASIPPAPTKRVTPGAGNHRRTADTKGFSDGAITISGLACSCEKPVKNNPCGVLTGAVNQRSLGPLYANTEHVAITGHCHHNIAVNAPGSGVHCRFSATRR